MIPEWVDVAKAVIDVVALALAFYIGIRFERARCADALDTMWWVNHSPVLRIAKECITYTRDMQATLGELSKLGRLKACEDSKGRSVKQ